MLPKKVKGTIKGMKTMVSTHIVFVVIQSSEINFKTHFQVYIREKPLELEHSQKWSIRSRSRQGKALLKNQKFRAKNCF